MTGLRAARPRRPPWAPISNPACGRDRSLYTGSLYTSPCFIDCLLRSRSIHNTPHRLTMGLQPELARHGTFSIVLCIFCQFCVTKLSIASRLTIWRLLMQKKTSHVYSIFSRDPAYVWESLKATFMNGIANKKRYTRWIVSSTKWLSRIFGFLSLRPQFFFQKHYNLKMSIKSICFLKICKQRNKCYTPS